MRRRTLAREVFDAAELAAATTARKAMASLALLLPQCEPPSLEPFGPQTYVSTLVPLMRFDFIASDSGDPKATSREPRAPPTSQPRPSVRLVHFLALLCGFTLLYGGSGGAAERAIGNLIILSFLGWCSAATGVRNTTIAFPTHALSCPRYLALEPRGGDSTQRHHSHQRFTVASSAVDITRRYDLDVRPYPSSPAVPSFGTGVTVLGVWRATLATALFGITALARIKRRLVSSASRVLNTWSPRIALMAILGRS